MIIQENVPLAQYTTFKIGGAARFFCSVKNIDEVKQAVQFAHDKKISFFILGGGSNLLISDEGFAGLVIKIEIHGITKEKEVKNGVEIITAGAGEMWDTFVEWTLENGFNGLENLSAIPGTVGAVPVQNIGAYGVEVGQFIDSVHALDTHTMSEVNIAGRDCHFGYRNSMFKHEKGRYIITQVNFALKKDGKANIEYKDLKQYLTANKIITPTQVREAVINIRWNKLPDWMMWGTAGSYFKNPVISKGKFDELKKQYPELPGYPDVDQIKIPLGWVLDNICKAKGVMHGGVGTYEKQALVIIAKPGATAKEVVDFTHDLMTQVKEKIGVVIEAEVEWVN